MVIEGFKSYKDQTILEPFSNRINCVGERRRCLPPFNVFGPRSVLLAILSTSLVLIMAAAAVLLAQPGSAADYPLSPRSCR